jgi:hypothetical protein
VESISTGTKRCLLVCAPTNKAISVLCTRVLDALNDCTIPLILLGDDDKLLDDDLNRNNQNDKEASKLRSIFLYTWIRTVEEDYSWIRKTLARTSNDQRQANYMYDLAARLEERISHSLPHLPPVVLEYMSKVTVYLKNASSREKVGGGISQSDIRSTMDLLLNGIRKWKTDGVFHQLLGSARVIFCTLASAGASVLRKSSIQVDDLIVDEAAAATEPEMYIPFSFGPQRLLAVGDPKQLPATVTSQRAVKFGLGKSLHERLMYDCHGKHIMLNVQYRMKPELSEFPSKHFYQGKLIDGSNVTSPDYRSSAQLLDGRAYSFLQVDGRERQARTGSYENEAEAREIVTLVAQLQRASQQRLPVPGKWDSADRIRIITFYQAQVALVKRYLQHKRLGNVVVATVDSSQGCEADIVIVSFVRSHSGSGKGTVGFLSDDRRMNVGLTRGESIILAK